MEEEAFAKLCRALLAASRPPSSSILLRVSLSEEGYGDRGNGGINRKFSGGSLVGLDVLFSASHCSVAPYDAIVDRHSLNSDYRGSRVAEFVKLNFDESLLKWSDGRSTSSPDVQFSLGIRGLQEELQISQCLVCFSLLFTADT